jgi:hypothetical protein
MKILIALFFVSVAVLGNCQNSANKEEIKKNLVYASVGSVLFPYTVNGFYERSLLRDENISLGVRLGIGKFEGFANSGMNYNAQLMLNLFFAEAGLGITQRVFDVSEEEGMSFAFNLGLRLYTKNRIFMFRGGVSLPEGLYVGVGFGFGSN